MSTNTDSERAAFEAWVSGKKWSIAPAREESEDDYMDTDTEIAWMAWHARAALDKQAGEGELPPLPLARFTVPSPDGCRAAYTADQVQEYARAALAKKGNQ